MHSSHSKYSNKIYHKQNSNKENLVRMLETLVVGDRCRNSHKRCEGLDRMLDIDFTKMQGDFTGDGLVGFSECFFKI